jgi:hypothetical protein
MSKNQAPAADLDAIVTLIEDAADLTPKELEQERLAKVEELKKLSLPLPLAGEGWGEGDSRGASRQAVRGAGPLGRRSAASRADSPERPVPPASRGTTR